MATEIDAVVMAISEILLSSNVPVKIVVFCSKGHLCVYVLMLFVGVFWFCFFFFFLICFISVGQVSWIVFTV